MIPKTVVLLLLQTTLSLSAPAPLQFPLLQPLQGTLQQQQLALQEQLLALQQFQMLQRLNIVPPLMNVMPPAQPILVLIPDTPENFEVDRYWKMNENQLKKQNSPHAIEDEQTDSITIDSETQSESVDKPHENTNKMRAFLLVPNSARFSLGGFISSLPFLPIEINVPDSITWIYNGIASIIAGIGQRWPFRPNSGNQGVSMKLWKGTKPSLPIVVMPMDPSVMQTLI